MHSPFQEKVSKGEAANEGGLRSSRKTQRPPIRSATRVHATPPEAQRVPVRQHWSEEDYALAAVAGLTGAVRPSGQLRVVPRALTYGLGLYLEVTEALPS